MAPFNLGFLAMVVLVGASYVASVKYVAEVYFVVEPSVVKNYMNLGYSKQTAISTIKGDIQFFIHEVNELYKSMQKNGVNLEVRQKKLDILDEELFEDCKLVRHKELQSDMGLSTFQEWLEKTQASKKIGYDIALAYTGFDIFGGSGQNSVTGYATTKAACVPESAVAIVEFDGTMNTVITTAHEIGHSLGMPHDEAYPCPSSDGYIMTPTAKVDNRHRWEFSYCSVKAMVSYINSLSKSSNGNCLLKTTTPSSSGFSMSSQSGRDVIDVQKICQRARKDKDSYFCSFPGFYNVAQVKGDAVCQKLMCGQRYSSTCGSAMPMEGMVCDVNKRCSKGKCVAATFSTPRNMDPECIFGDVKMDFFNGKKQTCEQFIQSKGLMSCYQQQTRDMCCESCKKKSSISGCEYGDKSADCQKYSPSNICRGAQNIDVCCFTCRNYVGKRSASNETLVDIKLSDDVTKPIVETIQEEEPKPDKVQVTMA